MSRGGIRVEGLARAFPGKPLLVDLGFSVAPGEGLVVRGANGSGKSTLLRILAGLVSPDAGLVRVGGRPPAPARPEIGWLGPGDRSLYWRLTPVENLRFLAEGRTTEGDREAEIRQALREFEVEALADRPVRLLSTGERRRVALASVGCGRPSVLLLDEPEASLDAAGRALLGRRLAARAAAGAALVVVLHDPELVIEGFRTLELIPGGPARFREEAGGAVRIERPGGGSAPGGEPATGLGGGWDPQPESTPGHCPGRGWATLAACLRRDLRALASYRVSLATTLGSALFQCVLFWYLARLVPAGSLPGANGGGDYFGFVVLGLLAHRLSSAALEGPGQSVAWEAVQGTLEGGLQTRPAAWLLAGGAGSGMLFRMAEAGLYLGLGLAASLSLDPGGLLLAAVALLLSTVAHLGLGLAGAGCLLAFKRGNPVGAVFASLQALASGVWFPVELLPPVLVPVCRELPLACSLRLVRAGFGQGGAEVAPDLVRLLVWCLVLVGSGRYALAAGLERARREGSLGEY